MSLLNTNYEYPNPIIIKNPYTNCSLNKSELYYLYYQLSKIENINLNKYINLFMISDFNLNTFLKKNYELLLTNSLDKYFKNINFNEKIEIFLEFMKYYNCIINERHFFSNYEYVDIINNYSNILKIFKIFYRFFLGFFGRLNCF